MNKRRILNKQQQFYNHLEQAEGYLDSILYILKEESGLNPYMAIQNTTDGIALVFGPEHPILETPCDNLLTNKYHHDSEFYLHHVLDGKHPELFGEWKND